MPDIADQRRQDAAIAIGALETGDRGRQQQERRGEDRRDDARGVHLQRQMRGLAAIDLVAALLLGVLHDHAAMGAFHEDDEGDDADRQHEQPDADEGRGRPLLHAFEQMAGRRGQIGDDAREDDQRGAVADAACGDLFAQPHQENGAADQRDGGDQAEGQTRIDDRRDTAATAHGFEAACRWKKAWKIARPTVA